MKKITLDQRSNDWLTWRNTGLGSSDAAAIVGMSPWTTPLSVWRQKVAALRGEKPAGKKDNGAMARGRRLEPHAVSLYEEMMGWQVPAQCGVHEEYEWAKVSLDGYNEAMGLFVEVKAPNREDHLTALSGKVPEKYQPQLHHQFLVSGCRLAHYISYSDYFNKSQELAIVPVRRDEEMVQELLAAEKEFWECVMAGKPPA